MANIAIIKTGGKQYTVRENDVLEVEKLEVADGKSVTFKDVLLVASEDGATVNVGKPVVKGATVTATVIATEKGEKVRSVKFRHKTRHVRTKNHRQIHTKLRIEKIAV